MFSLPNAPSVITDVERLGDWVELSLLASEDESLSSTEIADVIHDSMMVDEDQSSPQQEAVRIVEEIITVLRKRRRALGVDYPFTVKEDVIYRTGEWRASACYTLLAVADLGRFYDSVQTDYDPESPFTRLFEKVVRAGVTRIFGGTAVRFGVPREEGWPTSIDERLGEMAEQFGLDVGASDTEPTDKDIGLDVAVRFRFGDESAGTGILLVQCATGDNWIGKKGEPSLEEWNRLVNWRSPVIRALAFPWRRDIDDKRLGRLSIRFDAIFFDRLRLLSSGNPDKHLSHSELELVQGWCQARFQEFPSLSH